MKDGEEIHDHMQRVAIKLRKDTMADTTLVMSRHEALVDTDPNRTIMTFDIRDRQRHNAEVLTELIDMLLEVAQGIMNTSGSPYAIHLFNEQTREMYNVKEDKATTTTETLKGVIDEPS